MSDLYVSWSDYHQAIESLAAKIYHSGWQFNQIVCLARGGLRIGDLLSRIYDTPLAILSCSSYSGSEGRVRGKIKIANHLTMTTETLGSRVLLVDDLVDSGISLQDCLLWLKNHYAADLEEIKTAVLWYKACSVVVPDFYVEYLADSPWIHQPFERYEKMTPAEAAQLSKHPKPAIH
ncbi:phosphoribosyltransferase [Limnoraphis robusta]|uniref:Phosphoribosyltransferase n=2 Tax=Limnoraphis robusta TaxID=1118279 RepID=A0A0F5YDZ3_9CYAN|nr:phosphoribosyltransferase [Limnoraphis robusta]KKD36862.1 phosphoribosyltransferase [Limnoraphis robusta CS-951]MEA5520275.1 phosphoribosyltransferase [Limnoraphis robusta CCNP1315]MEA5548541.1 phosphoribosyltransferase [Limnoraphis robusta CCNP1324]